VRPPPPGFDPEIWASLETARQHAQAGRTADALAAYEVAWVRALALADHFQAMVTAHMAGVAEPDAAKKHRWNVLALEHADAIADLVRARGMYSSIYNNLGLSHGLQGDHEEARRCFERALSHLVEMQPEAAVAQRAAIERNVARLDENA
jgi:tetratricopeptide (TPR) repeat protein